MTIELASENLFCCRLRILPTRHHVQMCVSTTTSLRSRGSAEGPLSLCRHHNGSFSSRRSYCGPKFNCNRQACSLQEARKMASTSISAPFRLCSEQPVCCKMYWVQRVPKLRLLFVTWDKCRRCEDAFETHLTSTNVRCAFRHVPQAMTATLLTHALLILCTVWPKSKLSWANTGGISFRISQLASQFSVYNHFSADCWDVFTAMPSVCWSVLCIFILLWTTVDRRTIKWRA